jgi:methylmalonyl-CoA/ethylmalonyl-CoA epimerase
MESVVEYGISQVGMVVADMESTMRHYHKTFGWGPWKIYEYRPPFLTDLRVRGEPAEFTWIGAEAHAGDTWIELLEPLEGDSPLKDWLAKHGDGVHHLGYEAPDIAAAERLTRSLEEQGRTELISAKIGWMPFYYIETSPLIFEVWGGSADELTPRRTFP